MKKTYLLIILFIVAGFGPALFAQSVGPTIIGKPVLFDKSKPLRNVDPIRNRGIDTTWKKKEIINKLGIPDNQGDPNLFGPDPVLQNYSVNLAADEPEIFQNFPGVRNSDNNYNIIPPDTDGDVGLDHYFQMVNLSFEIFDKEGNTLYGPANNSTLWNGFTGPWTGTNDGDPIVIYDEQADRWIASQFALVDRVNGPYYELIAVSATSDPLGEWYRYAYEFDNMPDYPKLSVWTDSYYFTINQFANGSSMAGAGVCAVDREAMLEGDPDAAIVFFDLGLPHFSLLSSDLDGTIPPPEGSPAYMVSLGGGSVLNIYKVVIDWTNPDNSTIDLDQELPVASFSTNDIRVRQPGTSQRLSAMAGRLMFRLQYRNFDGYEAMVTNHTVNADGNGTAGVRWYELRKSEGEENWSVYQQGTYAPDDGNSRWMASVAMNKYGDIAVGYSVSGTDTYPSIRFAGQTSGAPGGLGVLNVPEASIYEGSNSQTGQSRWGDYACMNVDPVDDQTFWFTQEYSTGGWAWKTQIASFGFASFPVADFTSDEIIIPVGETVNFEDLTDGFPNDWEWTFSGASPNSSADKDPENIMYEVEGEYDVQLITSNVIGADTIVKENYITASSTILPEVDFTASDEAICVGEQVLFQDITEYAPIQWLWEFEPNTITFMNGTDENSQNPIVVFNDLGNYNVKLTAWNLNGASETIKENYISSGGYIPFYKETFEDVTLKSAGWTIENPDENFTWTLQETNGTKPGNSSVGIIFKEDQVLGQYDRLISPQMNLMGMSSAVLQFQHAFAQFVSGFSDSLSIYVSTDCSENWEKIFTAGEDGLGSFATHELAEEFWPETASDWCMEGWGASCIVLDLTPYTGNSGVRIAFESSSYFGNPMFIDNVIISQFVGQNEIGPDDSDLIVFPNPANENFKVTLPEGHYYNELNLVNHLGQVVYSKDLDVNDRNIDITPGSNWSKGVYFIKLTGNGESASRKVILN